MTLRTDHPSEYRAWQGAKQRVSNSGRESWANYGGRGIGMSSAWFASFEVFLADMGPKPSTGGPWTLERVNNDGGYEAGNCVWATWRQQQRNRWRRPWPNASGYNVVSVSYLLFGGQYPASEPNPYVAVVYPRS